MSYRPEPSPHSYLADIYPVTGEYPKPLTGIQKEAVEREFAAGSTAAPEVNVERLQKAYSEAKGSWFPAPPSNIVFREPKFKMAGFKPLAESAKTRHSSVKSKTPMAKKKAPAKKVKPVAKKKASAKKTAKKPPRSRA